MRENTVSAAAGGRTGTYFLCSLARRRDLEGTTSCGIILDFTNSVDGSHLWTLFLVAGNTSSEPRT